MLGSDGSPPAYPPTARLIAAAAAALREGRLVVFPTETVYGLGANALDAAAVQRIYEAKGRPSDNPLIVHCADVAMAKGLARRWTPQAEALAARFWPGPLTLVVEKAEHVPDATTAGLTSIALRVPADPVAAALLRGAAVPVAAPSANRSGRPSPTRLADAQGDLGSAVAVYLDGGETRLGLESTVVDVRDGAVILRPGAISAEEVAAVTPLGGRRDEAHSPGTRHRHYRPAATIHLAKDPSDARRIASGLTGRVAHVGPHGAPSAFVVPGPYAEALARRLYSLLRDADAGGFHHIIIEMPTPEGIGAAVLDRLRRATMP